MEGCEDLVGYIYIPQSQFVTNRSDTVEQTPTTPMWLKGNLADGAQYTFANKNWLFQQAGLPPVSTAVVTHTTISLFTLAEAKSQEKLARFSPIDVNNHTKTITPTVFKPSPHDPTHGLRMYEGTALKILGYVTITVSDKPYSPDALFALVQVVSDGTPKDDACYQHAADCW